MRNFFLSRDRFPAYAKNIAREVTRFNPTLSLELNISSRCWEVWQTDKLGIPYLVYQLKGDAGERLVPGASAGWLWLRDKLVGGRRDRGGERMLTAREVKNHNEHLDEKRFEEGSKTLAKEAHKDRRYLAGDAMVQVPDNLE